MSLRLRFTLTVALVAALATIVATSLSYRSTAHRLDRAVDESLRSSGLRMAREVTKHGINLDQGDGQLGRNFGGSVRVPANATNAASGDAQDDTIIGMRQPPSIDAGGFFGRGGPGTELVATQWIATTGTIVQQPNIALPVGAEDKAIAASKTERQSTRTVTIDGNQYRQLTIGIPGEGAVMVARNVDENKTVMKDLLNRFVALVIATSLAGALAAWMLARQATKKLVHMERLVTAMAATGDLSLPEPLDTSGSDEASKVALAFERLLSALRTSREQQQRLVEDASHELRTPLTSLRTNMSLLPKLDRLAPDDRANLLDDVRTEVEEMVRLVDELVEHATASGSNKEESEPIGLTDLAERCASVVRRRTSRAISVSGDASLVSAGPTSLARALSNLIGNAVKFDQTGAPIEVTVSQGVLTVRDHGPGFQHDDLARVFDRFFRAEDARSLPGSGLGLSIVSEVARRWGGSVEAANALGGGALMTFRLPPLIEPITDP